MFSFECRIFGLRLGSLWFVSIDDFVCVVEAVRAARSARVSDYCKDNGSGSVLIVGLLED